MARTKTTIRKDLPEGKKIQLLNKLRLGGTQILRCSTCKKTFSTRKSLQRHVREQHSGPRRVQFLCPHCFFESPRRSTVDRHRRSAHPGADLGLEISTRLFEPRENASKPIPWTPPPEAVVKARTFKPAPQIERVETFHGYSVRQPCVWLPPDEVPRVIQPSGIPGASCSLDGPRGHPHISTLVEDLHLSSSSNTSLASFTPVEEVSSLAEDLHLSPSSSSSVASLTPKDDASTPSSGLHKLPTSTRASLIAAPSTYTAESIYPAHHQTPDIILHYSDDEFLDDSSHQPEESPMEVITRALGMQPESAQSMRPSTHSHSAPRAPRKTEISPPTTLMGKSEDSHSSTPPPFYTSILAESPHHTGIQIHHMPDHLQRSYGLHWPAPHSEERWNCLDQGGCLEEEPDSLEGWTILDETPRIHVTPYQWGEPYFRRSPDELFQYKGIKKRYPARRRPHQ